MAMRRASTGTQAVGWEAIWRQLRRNDISVQLIATMLVLALLPVLLVSTVGNRRLDREVFGLERQLLTSGANDTAAALRAQLSRNLRPVEYMAKDEAIGRYAAAAPESRNPYFQRVITLLKMLQSQDPSFVEAVLYDGNGLPLMGQDGQFSSLERFDGQTWFQLASNGQSNITFQASTTPQGARPLLQYSAPIISTAGRFVGVLTLRTTVEPIEQLIAAGDSSNTGRRLVVLDEDGIVLFQSSPPDTTNWRYRSVVPLTTARQDALTASGRFGKLASRIEPLGTGDFAGPLRSPVAVDGFDTTLDGTAYYASLAPLTEFHGLSWRVAKLTPRTNLTASRTQQSQIFLRIGIILAVLTTTVAFFATRRVTQPLNALVTAAERIRAGDYAARVPIFRSGQFARAGEAFNAMVDRITASTSQQQAEAESLQRQIVKLLDEVSSVAEGNLTVEAEVTTDTLGAVADSFNYMIAELRGIIGRVNLATNQVGTSTDEILTTTDTLSRSAEQQAARIADTSTAIEEMAVSIQQVSENAAISAQVAREARLAADEGAQAVAATIDGMGRVRARVDGTARTIEGLAVSSREIGTMVALIRDVADQTQVLALNAAIRAAAAGQHGKGFAVVAEEVRRLSQRTTNASTQIEVLVKTIQTRTDEAITSMIEGTEEVSAGAAVADEAGRALARIDAISVQLAELIEAISLAAEQQARASAGIARAMGEVSSLTVGTSAGAHQVSASIAALAALADDLRASVAAFLLVNTPPPTIATRSRKPQHVHQTHRELTLAGR